MLVISNRGCLLFRVHRYPRRDPKGRVRSNSQVPSNIPRSAIPSSPSPLFLAHHQLTPHVADITETYPVSASPSPFCVVDLG